MANLWRTQRPRFPLYQSDGLGRDFYIKFHNGGYWENQFVISKKPDYARTKYNNFHSLFHMAAPFKYWGDGSGRENYILKCNGFHHDQRPLCSYELTDFLRNGKNIKGAPDNSRKKIYLSLSEIKYNQKLKNLEKKLVKRLYTEPMKKKKKMTIDIENGNKDKYGNKIEMKNLGYQTCGQFNFNGGIFKSHFNTLENKKGDEYIDRQNSYDGKINKHMKSLENKTTTLLPKFRKNLKLNNYKKSESDFNIFNDGPNKKTNAIKYLNKKNINLVNYDSSKNNCDEDIGYKKVIIGL